MFALFDEFTFPQLPATYALAQARYAYLWGDAVRGLQYVMPIADYHFDLKIADDNFLYIRGMPFFSQTWAYAAAFFELKNELDALRMLTKKATRVLVDYDASPLENLVQAVTSGDFSPYMASPRRGSAYERTLTAVLLAQREITFDLAIEHLNEVRLTDNDFPWLADILLLARSEAAHRHSVDEAQRLVHEFLRRQPMLFEPDHAFNFRLLGYQETLRHAYQESRRRSAG